MNPLFFLATVFYMVGLYIIIDTYVSIREFLKGSTFSFDWFCLSFNFNLSAYNLNGGRIFLSILMILIYYFFRNPLLFIKLIMPVSRLLLFYHRSSTLLKCLINFHKVLWLTLFIKSKVVLYL